MIAVVLSIALLAAPRYQGSEAEKDAHEQGATVVREITADVDGDAKDEIVVVERSKDKSLRVKIFSVSGEPDELVLEKIAESSPRRADRLLRLEVKEVTGDRHPDIIAVFEEASPDETLQHLRVLGKTGRGVVELFAHSVFIPRDPPVEGKVIELGDWAPRFAIREGVSEDGAPAPAQIAWVRGPQILQLDKGKEPASVIIGAYETVYRFDGDKGTFVEEEEQRVVDFAPAKTAYTVEASSQVPKIWGTAQAFWGADGDLETAWAVAGKKLGAGESITVHFKTTEEVSLIRVVPGCAANKEAWAAADRIDAFTIELSSGARFEVDRKKLGELPAAIQAAGEYPLEDVQGAQVLLLLKEKASLKWGRLTITRIEPAKIRGQRDREACLAEISFH